MTRAAATYAMLKGKAGGQRSYGSTTKAVSRHIGVPTTTTGGGRAAEFVCESLERVLEDDESGRYSAEDGFEGGVGCDGQSASASDLEEVGLSPAQYNHLLHMHALIPFIITIIFILLTFLPFILFQPSSNSKPTPISLFCIIVLSAALWSLSHVLRVPVYKAVEFVSKFFARYHGMRRRGRQRIANMWTGILTTTLLVIIQELLRLSSFLIITIPSHHARPSSPLPPPDNQPAHHTTPPLQFYNAWFIALGWALAEVIAGIAQSYEQLGVYQDLTTLPLLLSRRESGRRKVQTEVRERMSGGDILDDDVNMGYGGGEVGDGHGDGFFEVAQGPERIIVDSPILMRNPPPPRPQEPTQKPPSDTTSSPPEDSDHTIYTSTSISGCRAVKPVPSPSPLDAEMSVGVDVYVDLNGNRNRDVGMSVDVEEELEDEVTRLVNLKARAELEEVYGVAFVDIPIFVTLLQRLDSIILSLGLTLLLSSSLQPPSLSSPTIPSNPSSSSSFNPSSKAKIWLTWTSITTIHAILSFLYTPPILGKIGAHTAAYIGMMVGLACVFAGLGGWGVLV